MASQQREETIAPHAALQESASQLSQARLEISALRESKNAVLEIDKALQAAGATESYRFRALLDSLNRQWPAPIDPSAALMDYQRGVAKEKEEYFNSLKKRKEEIIANYHEVEQHLESANLELARAKMAVCQLHIDPREREYRVCIEVQGAARIERLRQRLTDLKKEERVVELQIQSFGMSPAQIMGQISMAATQSPAVVQLEPAAKAWFEAFEAARRGEN